MKAKDLVIGKIYKDSSFPEQLVKYVGVIEDIPFFNGQHDFDNADGNPNARGCVCTDEDLAKYIRETRQPDAPKYDRGQKISLYGLLIILGLMVFLAVVSQNLA